MMMMLAKQANNKYPKKEFREKESKINY